MKKRIIGGVIAGLLLLGALSGAGSDSTPPKLNSATEAHKNTTSIEKYEPKEKPLCDGITITTKCVSDGISYATYIYHPAAAEKTHTETVTTYEEKITGYCTLCNDGTYSPSCATGRGACSHHGGVAEWNAPRYSSIPVTSTKTVIDSPAREAFYEKVAE